VNQAAIRSFSAYSPGKPSLGGLSGGELGVVGEALEPRLDPAGARSEDGEAAARVAVLGLADRAAVDEEHPAVLVDPRLVGVAEHEYVAVGAGGDPLERIH
jgi:hypothetical protein